MRRFLLAVMMAGMAASARAADMPDFLRGSLPGGPAPTVNWQGFYIGGQGGLGESDMNFTGATQSVAAKLLANTAIEGSGQVSSWPVGSKVSVRGSGWGGFAGYNSQWDDVVIGVELSYMHGKFGGTQTDSMGRIFTDGLGYTDSVTYQNTATMSVSDMGTLRARAGYAVGSFLPYVFGGVALGQADIVRTAHIFGTQVNAGAAPGFQNIPFDLSATEGQYSHLVYGYSGGLGVDMMLTAGLFLRAEWEYVRFTSSIDTSINTVRVGLGYKF
ncbi:outer membrane beta-barrel protein [Bradyrhizobium sp. dw_78]|uniref:outer membrane protein n=1 Tax=Bradyrhizobium sp. dw_78 TaxID=2719793 RepID=UPI001BD357D1|nr:outer membrane beta-barrel protein [Bradyrhizobium sp. dw_78]